MKYTKLCVECATQSTQGTRAPTKLDVALDMRDGQSAWSQCDKCHKETLVWPVTDVLMNQLESLIEEHGIQTILHYLHNIAYAKSTEMDRRWGHGDPRSTCWYLIMRQLDTTSATADRLNSST